MFIRRGFFKLRFEIEAANGSQEVNMLDANNGNGGNNDAQNGGHNNGDGNDMEMDPKGIDEGATSNTYGHGDTNENNGMDGMQLQAQQLQDIKVGSINVDLSPTGTSASPQNFVQKQFFPKPISHVEVLMLNDKIGTVCDTDSSPSKSALGLPQVCSRSATASGSGSGVPNGASLLGGARTEGQLAPLLLQQLAAMGQQPALSSGGSRGLSLLSASAGGTRDEKLVSSAAAGGHSEFDTRQRGGKDSVWPGCSVLIEARPSVVTPLKPQKIRTGSGGLSEEDRANQAPMIGMQNSDPLGSSVYSNTTTNGLGSPLQNSFDILNDNVLCNSACTSQLVSNGQDTHDVGTTRTSEMVDSLDQRMDGTRRRLHKEGVDTIGCQKVGTVSSINANGISSFSLLDPTPITIPTLSLSLIESSPIVPVQPTDTSPTYL
jgi:hypothetical protein